MSFINLIPKFEHAIDLKVAKDIEYFFININDRLLYKMNFLDNYFPPEEALGLNVEYFHFNLTGDDRMRYIGENIVLEDHLSDENKMCNAIITHLYGGRRINSLLTGIIDPKKAHIDFNKINTNAEYVKQLSEVVTYAKKHGYKFYGTTELHTSLQTAARNFCRWKYSDKNRPVSNLDIVEWVANFINIGLINKILNSNTLKEAFDYINLIDGIGAYYGYHLSVDSSLVPNTKFHHDEKFCVPGKGACYTLDLLFPTLKQYIKKIPYGELIIWIEENQTKIYPNITFHPSLFNIINFTNGKKLLKFDQTKLMVYGLEVGHCQYGIYDRLKKHPNLIKKRKCGTDPDLTLLESRNQNNINLLQF